MLGLVLLLAASALAENWRVMKKFNMGDMGAVRNDWYVEKWPAYHVNAEMQAYVDSPANLYTRDGNLILRAKRGNGGNMHPGGQSSSGGGGGGGGGGKSCVRHDGMDIPGHDEHGWGPADYDRCAGDCMGKAVCKGFVVVGGKCYIKNAGGPMRGSGGHISGDCSGSGAAPAAASAPAHSGSGCDKKDNMEIQGADAHNWGPTNYETCQGDCMSKSVCRAFTFKGQYGVWPQEGEIDVMEWVFQQHGKYPASLHWKGGTDWSDHFSVSETDMRNKWNTYGVEWSAKPGDEYIHFYFKPEGGAIRWGSKKAVPSQWKDWATKPQHHPRVSCNGWSRHTGAKTCGGLAPFDNPSKLILNLAVGGEWGGCCGVNNDYSAFDGNGVEFPIKAVTVYHN